MDSDAATREGVPCDQSLPSLVSGVFVGTAEIGLTRNIVFLEHDAGGFAGRPRPQH